MTEAQLPPTTAELGPLAQIIDRCLIHDPAHRTASAHALLTELEALAPARRAVMASDGANPFAGLAAFQETDAGRFFGRDRDIEQVVAALRSRPLVAVLGPSGAGKSSLIRAGVIPALKRSGEGWDAHVVRPGTEPLAALARVVAQLAGTGADRAAGDAQRSALAQIREEAGYLGTRLRAHAANRRRRIALFVDQLEELYTLGASHDERSEFLACLAAVADDASSPLRVLVSMRSDFLDRLSEERRLGVEVTRGLILLPAMDRDGLREALIRPVEACDHGFEPPALVDRMVDAVATASGALPLLQFTAERLWERRDRDRRVLTEASYQQLGGVAGALAMHADAVLAGMSAAQQALARSVLERLITPVRTRALVSMSDLAALQPDPAPVDEVVHHLAAMRLVVVERGPEGAAPTVELVHESLIDRWPTLARWLDDNQDSAAMLARLRAVARDWQRSGHAAGLLWTGDVAQAARAWRPRYARELAPIEKRYLDAVFAAADRALRVRRRMFRAVLSIAVVIAVAMAWLARRQTEAREEAIALARAAADEAMRARDATRMAAMRTLPGDPTTQLALVREVENSTTAGAAQTASDLLYADIALVVLTGPELVSSAAFSPDGRLIASSGDGAVHVWRSDGDGEPLVLRGHTRLVGSVAFSPDGLRIASASSDHTVRVWRADGEGEPLVLRGHGDGVWSATFSPDGQRIASASSDATVRIWRADGTGEPVVLRTDRASGAVAFSPDATRVAAASGDTVVVWRADGSAEPLVLRGHDGGVRAVAFSPDGTRIASAADDKTARIWNADGSGQPLVLRGHGGAVHAAAFSPDGRCLLSASDDRTMRLWRADRGDELRIVRVSAERVLSAAFSADGGRIVSASADRTVRVWSTERGAPAVLYGHGSGVSSVAFSPDGRRIASGSSDLTVRVWSTDGRIGPRILRGHRENITSVAFSPDGRRILSASYDGTIRLWDADGDGEPLVLRGHQDAVRSAAFSSDGRRIVSASADRTVRVWNADGSGRSLVLHGHEQLVDSAVFSVDDRRIVSASWDGTVRVWSADGRGEPLVLRGHDTSVRSATFSSDGQRVVSAATDGTVRVWNADGGGTPLVLRGHTGWVFWAEFSPDGRRIASASRDKTIRIWHADGTGEPVVLTGHDLPVTQARFSADGTRIVSASVDQTIRIWRDLAPSLDDPRLWTATSYCMPVERRIELLGMSREQAERDRLRCLERVERARSNLTSRTRR